MTWYKKDNSNVVNFPLFHHLTTPSKRAFVFISATIIIQDSAEPSSCACDMYSEREESV